MRPSPSHGEPTALAPATPRELHRCFAEDLSGAAARPLGALLDRTIELHDRGDFATALLCAEEASRVDPRSIEAHEDRALALAELGRKDEARAALGRALALDPDDANTLFTAADLYLNRLGSKSAIGDDDAAAALEYAKRGVERLRRARGKADRKLRARLELLAGQALSDMGRAKEALPHLDASIAAAPDELPARYERGLALFELCRFADAERALREVIARDAKDAFAHQQLGLVLEQLGDEKGSIRELAEAHRLNPTEIRTPLSVDRPAFERIVHEQIAALPPRLRDDLGKVDLELPDLPAVADLTADDPPLPPTILGLFRGTPLDEPSRSARLRPTRAPHHGEATLPEERRAIALYRLNLLRSVQSEKELVEQVRTTLWHELGHLRGEDDDALRARGLE
jgi:tetratricopeptide (TPR) repeat protein